MNRYNNKAVSHGTKPWRTVSARLFILALTILLPFQITSISLLMLGRTAIQNEIKSSAFSATHSLTEMLNREILNVQQQIDALTTNSQINSFMLNPGALPPSLFYMELLDHYRLLRSVLTGSLFIQDAAIYYRGLEKANTASMGYVTMEPDESNRMQNALAPMPGLFRLYGDAIVVGGFYPQSSALFHTSAQPAYTVVITISRNSIHDLLSTASSDRTMVLYSHAFSEVLAQNGATLDNGALETILAEVSGDDRVDIELSVGGMYVVSIYSALLDCSVVQIIPEAAIFNVPYKYTLIILLFSFAGILALALYAVISHRLIKKPVSQMLEAFALIESGKLNVSVPSRQVTREFAELVTGFNQMSSRLLGTVEELYIKEIYAHRMELKQLQAQINPHFLYNTYFLLHRLIDQEDNESAVRLSRYLGEYFQYITRNYNDKVPLHIEWKHALTYLDIQAMRFSDRLDAVVSPLPDDATDFPVPRLIIQPIIENAIEYGLDEITGCGRITLSLLQCPQFLYIKVSNTGKRLSEKELESIRSRLGDETEIRADTTAITNIHRRLLLEYGPNSGLQADPATDGGLIVTLKIAKTALPMP